MKKIYNIKSLSLVAFALMANVAVGQNLMVTSDGQPVENGAVIQLPYEFEDNSWPEYDLYSYSYLWDPNIEVSTVEGEEDITVTVESLDNTEGYQLCWPQICQFAKPNAPVSSRGTVSMTPTYLSIHQGVTFDKEGEVPSESDLASIKVTIAGNTETIEVIVKSILADKNGVEGVVDDSNATTLYYTLDGIQVEKPTKGIYVVRKGGKAKLIKI